MTDGSYRKPLFSPPNISHPTIQSDRASQNSLIELIRLRLQLPFQETNHRSQQSQEKTKFVPNTKRKQLHSRKSDDQFDFERGKAKAQLTKNLGKVVKCKLYSFCRDKSVMESAISFCNWDENILIFGAILPANWDKKGTTPKGA